MQDSATLAATASPLATALVDGDRQQRRPGQAAGRNDAESLSSVRNAARLLRAFTAADRDLGVSELATRLGLAKSTVHRLLTTLTREGLIERSHPNGRYRLGLRLYELGSIVPSHVDLREAVGTTADELRTRTAESVRVGILDGADVVFLERRDTNYVLRLHGRTAPRNPAHCTSSGKVLLAYLSQAERSAVLGTAPLTCRTPSTITDRARLEEELARVRARGWAENVNESDPGLVSVAAPVRDASGRVVAAIGVAGPAAHFTRENTRRYAAETVWAAEAISSRLGHRVRENGRAAGR